MLTPQPPSISARAGAENRSFPSVSVIVPTYREVLNIPLLLGRLADVREQADLELEVLFMDDDSQDGSEQAVASFGADWARIVVRTDNRGLSPAVVDGLKLATKDVVLVMDADLSHPAEKIPEMLRALQSGQQFVIGSRYVAGGSTDDDWGFVRWMNSRVATLLARPLTAALDPMAGFFAMWREDLARAEELSPVGYKIGLELIVKCDLANVCEIPIHFTDREHGESKLTLREQLLYIKHLRRLYIHRFGALTDFVQFAVVGASGLVVNLAVLTLLTWLGLPESVSVAAAIAVSMVSNFVLNRRFTFGYARAGNVWAQFVGFCSACSVGAVVNYAATMALRATVPALPLQVAAIAGVFAGLGFNFITNRFLVFRKRHVRPKD